MLANIRIELLEIAIQRHTHAVVAEFLCVPVAQVYGWLLGREAVPDTALLALVDLMDPNQRRH